ncbi:MAG: hypothetical protein QW567_04845 [Candidatus Hadarchaeales archaeon]
MKMSMKTRMNKKLLAAAAFVAVAAVAALLILAGTRPGEERRQPLELLMGYEPPENEYPAPEFITEGLPDDLVAGEPTITPSQYPDGTPVTVMVASYTSGDNTVIVQMLDVCGEVFISNTPEIENYTFELVKLGGSTVVKYSKGEEYEGYVWYHGKYSIAVYTSPSGFPSYLTDLAELYVKRYPSTM